ncbi:glycoside hydrolase superfamily [Phlyctochytrium arcticum]|nr:glycoside hydrolase superfamily [Phlyctochytrium arcticum]
MAKLWANRQSSHRPTTLFLPNPWMFFSYLILCFLTLLPSASHAQGPGGGSTPNIDSNPATSDPSSDPNFLAPLEPPTGKFLLGAWLDTSPSAAETPAKFNARLGYNASAFQFTLNIPANDADLKMLEAIDKTDSDALVHLSVLPTKGLDLTVLGTADLQRIVNICRGFNIRGRGVFLRFAPGMNLPWVAWGQQPSAFITQWRTLGTLIRDTPETNRTAMVWAPYDGTGYPWPSNPYSVKRGSADWSALDTNQDGNVTALDDPYRSYYPGDDNVDWVGLSVYHKGDAWPWLNNSIPRASALADALQGKNSPSLIDFYDTYARTRNKPVMLAETGAVFHLSAQSRQPTSKTPTELATKRAWWTQFLNPAFRSTFPKLKLISLYEAVDSGQGPEAGTLLDYRVTNATLNEFVTDLKTVAEGFIWANYTGLRTTFVPSDADDSNGTGKGKNRADDDPGSSSHGEITRAVIIAAVLLPILGVAIWIAYAHYQRHKLRRQITEALINSTNDVGNAEMKEEGEMVEVEDVDDGATIVNVRIGPGPRSDADDDNDSEGGAGLDDGDFTDVDSIRHDHHHRTPSSISSISSSASSPQPPHITIPIPDNGSRPLA